MRKLFAVLFCCAALCTLSACNTVEGFGKDVQKVGEKLENKASR